MAYLVPLEGDTVVGMRIVVFGRSWSGAGNDNSKGVINGAARTETHLCSASASMKTEIIVSFL